jgi:hypothetical protein
MSAKEAPSLSASRKNQKTPLLVPKEIAPQIKTSVGITYASMSSAVLAAVDEIKSKGKLSASFYEKFKDALFLSPRLAQWELNEWPNGMSQWRIYANDDSTFVIVDKKSISLHRGERGNWEVTNDALIAASLFSAIEQAQAIVSTTVEEPMTDEEQESYFDGGVQFTGAALDEALADTHAEPLCVDDADLIHDVTAEEALDEDQRQEDGPNPIITVSSQFIEAVQQVPQRFENKNVDRVEAEVARVKEEYPELQAKGQKPKVAQEEVGKMAAIGRGTASRLKSLQGRILTIMDASIADKEQRAAVKTLINKEFRRDISQVNGNESSEE